MTNNYTTCDIEVHLPVSMNGLESYEAGIELDESASIKRLESLVEAALDAAYPQYSVSVFTEHVYGGSMQIAAIPDDVAEENIAAVVDRVMGDYEAWLVYTPASAR